MGSGNKTSTLLLIALGAVALIALIGGAYWYFNPAAPPADDARAKTAELEVGAEVSGAVETPAEKMPETNPFQTETNPFKGYKNPFD